MLKTLVRKMTLPNDFSNFFKKVIQKYNFMSGQNISNLRPLQQKSLDGLMRQDVVASLPT